MNEPVPGFLGVKHLNQLYGPLRNGNMTTAFEGMALASGVTTNVRFFSATSLKCLITRRPLRHTTRRSTQRASVLLAGLRVPVAAGLALVLTSNDLSAFACSASLPT